MGWLIGRTMALSDPERARGKALEKLQGLTEIEDPEGFAQQNRLELRVVLVGQPSPSFEDPKWAISVSRETLG